MSPSRVTSQRNRQNVRVGLEEIKNSLPTGQRITFRHYTLTVRQTHKRENVSTLVSQTPT